MSGEAELRVGAVRAGPESPGLAVPAAVLADCGLRPGSVLRVRGPGGSGLLRCAAGDGPELELGRLAAAELGAAPGNTVRVQLSPIDRPAPAQSVAVTQLDVDRSGRLAPTAGCPPARGAVATAVRELLTGRVVGAGSLIGHRFRGIDQAFWVTSVSPEEPVVIGVSTQLAIHPAPETIPQPPAGSELPEPGAWAEAVAGRFAGYPSVCRELVDRCRQALSGGPVRGVLVCGAAGSGKSLLVRAVAEAGRLPLRLFAAAELVASSTPEQAVADAVEAAGPGRILVIDQIHLLAPRSGGAGTVALCAVVGQVMDGLPSGSLVLATCSTPEAVNPALLRAGRFGHCLAIRPPKAEQRMAILQAAIAKAGSLTGTDFATLATRTSGCLPRCREAHRRRRYTAADLRALCSDAVALKSHPKLGEFEYALTRRAPAGLETVGPRRAGATFSSVAGLDGATSQCGLTGRPDAVRALRSAVICPLDPAWQAGFARLGVEPPRGVLLHGPPGCGKSLLAEAVANELGCGFIEVQAPVMLSRVVGQSESNLAALFARARAAAPCVLFIDQLEALAPRRTVSSASSGRLLSQMLTEMDGMKRTEDARVVVMAASCHPDKIDPAAIRAGRIELMIEVSLSSGRASGWQVPRPDLVARTEILRLLASKVAVSREGLEGLVYRAAEMTDGLSGAELANICQEAALETLRENIGATEVPHAAIERQCRVHSSRSRVA